MESLSYVFRRIPSYFSTTYDTLDYFIDNYNEGEGNEELFVFYDKELHRSSLTRSEWSRLSNNLACNLSERGKKG